jgi:hypothetical protein
MKLECRGSPSVPIVGFYLDTSALRAYSSRDEWLADAEAFTSVLTLIELLDGCTASELEYAKRSAAVRTLVKFRIHVVPCLPSISVTRAFPVIGANYKLEHTEYDAVNRLAALMLDTPEVENFANLLAADSEWQRVCQAYADMAQSTVLGSTCGGIQLREKFQAASAEELSRIGIAPSLSTGERIEQFTSSELNLATSIYTYALHASECLGYPDDEALQAKIYGSYNGLAGAYFRALSLAQLSRIRRGEIAGKNDSYDLDHFAYLEPGVILTTNDKRMAALAGAVGIRAIRSSELAPASRESLQWPRTEG